MAARFNSAIVEAVAGALDGLKRHGVADDAIDLVRVPGSFEIPLVAQRLAGGGKYAAVICLGAVIRGDTDHYDHVAGEAAAGVARAALATGVPVIFGILTCDTLEQAHQPRRRQGRQQGLRRGADGHRDGQSVEAVAVVNPFAAQSSVFYLDIAFCRVYC